MSDNNTTPATEENTASAAEVKTFSQDDVNRIVSERLSKEKAKTDAAFAQREQELQKRELMITARELLAEKGLPADLHSALNANSPEELEQSISTLVELFNKNLTNPQGSPVKPSVPGTGGNPPMEPIDRSKTIRGAMGLK